MSYQYTSYSLSNLDSYYTSIVLFGDEYLLTVVYNYTSGLRYINIKSTNGSLILLRNTYIREFDRVYINNPYNESETLYLCLSRKTLTNKVDYHFWNNLFELCVVPFDVDNKLPVVKYIDKDIDE